ncbi:hypothetical protein MTO96_013940 [Rhipicephalus appendiculatus]
MEPAQDALLEHGAQRRAIRRQRACTEAEATTAHRFIICYPFARRSAPCYRFADGGGSGPFNESLYAAVAMRCVPGPTARLPGTLCAPTYKYAHLVVMIKSNRLIDAPNPPPTHTVAATGKLALHITAPLALIPHLSYFSSNSETLIPFARSMKQNRTCSKTVKTKQFGNCR